LLRQHSRAVEAALRLIDVSILVVALPMAHEIRDAIMRTPSVHSIGYYLPFLSMTLLLWLTAAWMFQVYDVYRTRSVGTELSRIGRALAVVALSALAVSYLAKEQEASRLSIGLYFTSAFVLLVANRIAVRRFARAARRRGYNTRRFAVVGTGDIAEYIIQNRAEHPEWGFQFTGFILENGQQPESLSRPSLGRLGQLGEILQNNVLDEVIFAVSRDHLDVLQPAVRLCEEQGVEVKISLNFFQAAIGRMSMEEVSGLPALAFSTTPADEVALVLKRAFDILSSAIALVLLAPALAAMAVAVKLDSPGPVFFRQRRVGLHGRGFVFYKFRSMCVDAEARLESLREFNEVTGPVFKMRQDPRVTKVGRFLRRTSLDEVPQFWNVLKGEMSIVGPRPPTPDEVRKYKPWQRRRLSMKPGITCTWQVSGRSDIDFDRWMKLDLAYIDNWSLTLDLKILLKTIPAVLGGRGAS
jgi:exopolysaccharide biosynthesis polyprenyl glycosylphosphotransferase